MKKGCHVFQYKDERYAVRCQIRDGKVLKCGYRRKCGVWYYAPVGLFKGNGPKQFFDNREPRSFKQVLDYVLYVMFCKDKKVFDDLFNATIKDRLVQRHQLVLIDACRICAQYTLENYWEKGFEFGKMSFRKNNQN